MKVVIDTNCLIASINRNRPEFWLYNSFINEDFEWLISNEILMEYLEVISSIYSFETAKIVGEILVSADNTIMKEPFYKWQLIQDDPDDNKFADLAIAGNVDYLVSNDKHFNILKTSEFPTVKVVTLNEFQFIMGY
jgi:putative PIN family toxin of toxin-antitoxin system